MTQVSDDLTGSVTDDVGSVDEPDDPRIPGAPGGSGDSLPPVPPPRRRWRRGRGPRRPIDKGLVVVSLVIGLGLFLVIRGLSAGISGDARNPLPELIESVAPVPEAQQVFSKERVFVDLQSGYTGVLVINGVELETVNIRDLAESQDVGPGQQLSLPPVTIYEGGNNTLTFVPNDNAPITEFATGEQRVQVIYWEETIGRQRAKSFSWTFNVI